MALAPFTRPRSSVDGKFFRLGGTRFYVKGAAYGPLAPPAGSEAPGLASPEQTGRDFALIRELGANLIRVYYAPPQWFLDLAEANELKVLVNIPWNQQTCFLDSARQRAEAVQAVRHAVAGCAGHPAVFAFSVANEIPPDIVRWSGARAVAEFINLLIAEAKGVDSECLCTYTNYPPTEFLQPQSADFACFNVYLHHRLALHGYLARLQMLAGPKPLLLGEFGLDSLREGEANKCTCLEWQIEEAFRGGLAGAIVFAFTDDWWRAGQPVQNWAMGLTTRERQPKDSFRSVQRMFQAAPHFPLSRFPKVSVVVACYNGERTLRACLDSLYRLNYPDYEVILVDDGSTDGTARIAEAYPKLRCFRHETNLGLSIARNTGIAAAAGEIVAFTDCDCRADEDWLYYLVGDLVESDFAGIGGPNLLPPEDSPVAAVVMASPGGPAHVMLTDRQAEHIPGCNMAFYKRALNEIGGFDPIFRKAGDDVDLCWRLEQADYKIGFSPSAFVWHYRRPTIKEYLKQQYGYGGAEALLVRKHPEGFNTLGGSVWRGRIYTTPKFAVLLRPPIIYRGPFGSAGFQFLYTPAPAVTLTLCTNLEYHAFVTLPLWVLSAVSLYMLPLASVSLLLSVGVCAAAAAQATLPRNRVRRWSRPLVAMLFFLQAHRARLGTLPVPADLAAPAPRRPADAPVGEPPRQRPGAGRGPVLGRAEDQPAGLCGRVSRTARAAGLALPGGHRLERIRRRGIYNTRWSKIAAHHRGPEYPGGKRLIACRLRPRWSLKAKLSFWLLSGLELVLLGLLTTRLPWLWLLLLTLPLFAWFLGREQRDLQSLIGDPAGPIGGGMEAQRGLATGGPEPARGGAAPAAPDHTTAAKPPPPAAAPGADAAPPARPVDAASGGRPLGADPVSADRPAPRT